MKIFSVLCFTIILKISQSHNDKLLSIERNYLTEPLKEFIGFIIRQNYQQKDGFLFIAINDVESEILDYSMKTMNTNGTVIIVDFSKNQNIRPLINARHFKFVLADPEGDLSYAEQAFKRVRVSRAKIVLVLTRKPLQIFIDYVLKSYWKIKCINIIVVYESGGQIEVITYNPYLPTTDKTVNLTESKYSKDLFEDKTLNLHGTTINCLLTYFDRTKIRRIRKSNEVFYVGKDYMAIATIVKHLNGNLNLITMDNVLFNPWFESFVIDNRTHRKIEFLKRYEISILIKSEKFESDDDILDNIYPHTQNDLCSLALKSSEIPVGRTILTTFTPIMWAVNILAPSCIYIIIAAIRMIEGHPIRSHDLVFDIYRSVIVNNFFYLPRNGIEKILLLSWLIYCFVTNVLLQSKITSTLAIKKFYQEIDTIDDLFASGLSLYSIPNHIEEIERKYKGTPYEHYAKSMIALGSNEGLTDQMTYSSDGNEMAAFITEHDIAVFVARCKNFRKNNAPIYHLVRECFIPRYQAYKVTHRSPLLPITNKIVRRLGEAGFINLWAKWADFNETLEGFLFPEDYDENRNVVKALSLDVVYLGFYILIMGYIIAFFVFLLEIWAYKRANPKPFMFVL